MGRTQTLMYFTEQFLTLLRSIEYLTQNYHETCPWKILLENKQIMGATYYTLRKSKRETQHKHNEDMCPSQAVKKKTPFRGVSRMLTCWIREVGGLWENGTTTDMANFLEVLHMQPRLTARKGQVGGCYSMFLIEVKGDSVISRSAFIIYTSKEMQIAMESF